MNKILFYAASALYHHVFPAYKKCYFFYKNIYERDEISMIKRIIKPGFTVLDIGSNIGFYTILFSDLVKDGIVHCFEPDKENFQKLEATCGSRHNIILNQLAVSDSEKAPLLYRSNRINVDHRTYPVTQYESSYEVKAVSIDNYIKKSFKVNLIKLDIQGFEFDALKGMQETLMENPDIIVVMEIWPNALSIRGIPITEIIRFISGLGFRIFTFSGNMLRKWHKHKLDDYKKYGKDQYDDIIFFREIPAAIKEYVYDN